MTLEELREKEGELFTEVEAAEELGISRLTLYRKRHRGEIGHYRVPPNRVYYAPRQLADYRAGRAPVEIPPKS